MAAMAAVVFNGATALANVSGPYFSTDGLSWTSQGPVFTESKYVSKGWTPSGANHLWAPQMYYSNSKYWLFVPDVSDLANESTSSYIGVSSSSSPFGPFTVQAKL